MSLNKEAKLIRNLLLLTSYGYTCPRILFSRRHFVNEEILHVFRRKKKEKQMKNKSGG